MSEVQRNSEWRLKVGMFRQVVLRREVCDRRILRRFENLGFFVVRVGSVCCREQSKKSRKCGIGCG